MSVVFMQFSLTLWGADVVLLFYLFADWGEGESDMNVMGEESRAGEQ